MYKIIAVAQREIPKGDMHMKMKLSNLLKDDEELVADLESIGVELNDNATFLVFTAIAVLITIIKQPDMTDSKPFREETTTFYLSPEPVSTSDILDDMFTEGHDGSITYYKSIQSIAVEDNGTEHPAFAIRMELPSDITEKVDGVGVSCSYLEGKNVAASVEYTYPASSGNVIWKGYVNKPGTIHRQGVLLQCKR